MLLRQTTVPTVIDSYYLLTLGSYRAFYILNWIWRELDITDRKPDAVSVLFGILQTAFYIDFAWVYYSRQRVKLRHGGIVDADDLHNGWLLRTVFGYKAVACDVEAPPALGGEHGAGDPIRNSNSWGTRGISISADDSLADENDGSSFEDQDGSPGDRSRRLSDLGENAQMKDPDEMAQFLDEDEEELMNSTESHPNPVFGR